MKLKGTGDFLHPASLLFFLPPTHHSLIYNIIIKCLTHTKVRLGKLGLKLSNHSLVAAHHGGKGPQGPQSGDHIGSLSLRLRVSEDFSEKAISELRLKKELGVVQKQ